MKNPGLRIVALLILQALWLEASHSADPGRPKFDEEFSRQESIFQSKGAQVPDGYTIDRSLADYVQLLSAEFDRTLANLGPKDRWLDIGAGRGQAIWIITLQTTT